MTLWTDFDARLFRGDCLRVDDWRDPIIMDSDTVTVEITDDCTGQIEITDQPPGAFEANLPAVGDLVTATVFQV